VIPNDRGKIFKGFSDWLLRLLSSLLGKCIESLAQPVFYSFLLKSDARDAERERRMRHIAAGSPRTCEMYRAS
jgi:hypothetical protein